MKTEEVKKLKGIMESSGATAAAIRLGSTQCRPDPNLLLERRIDATPHIPFKHFQQPPPFHRCCSPPPQTQLPAVAPENFSPFRSIRFPFPPSLPFIHIFPFVLCAFGRRQSPFFPSHNSLWAFGATRVVFHSYICQYYYFLFALFFAKKATNSGRQYAI